MHLFGCGHTSNYVLNAVCTLGGTNGAMEYQHPAAITLQYPHARPLTAASAAAAAGVILAPVFIIDIVQEAITMFQFLVVFGFLAALLWLFRPQQDSPYLLMGEDVEHLDTSLGVDDDAAEFAGENGANGVRQRDEQRRNVFAGRDGGSSSGVELAGMGAAAKGGNEGGVSNGGNNVRFTLDGDGVSCGRDQSGAGAAASAADLPEVRLPAIRTSIPGPAQQQQQQQRQQPQAAAAAKAANGAGPQWSLGDDDELHEITLHGSSPQKKGAS
jgi:hypothetical protein